MSFLQRQPACPPEAGRIEIYVHSDSVTENKGGCMVRVRCETDFAARTQQFKDFAGRCAKLCYGAGSEDWKVVTDSRTFPELERERKELEQALGEDVTVSQIVLLYVNPPREPEVEPEIERKLEEL